MGKIVDCKSLDRKTRILGLDGGNVGDITAGSGNNVDIANISLNKIKTEVGHSTFSLKGVVENQNFNMWAFLKPFKTLYNPGSGQWERQYPLDGSRSLGDCGGHNKNALAPELDSTSVTVKYMNPGDIVMWDLGLKLDEWHPETDDSALSHAYAKMDGVYHEITLGDDMSVKTLEIEHTTSGVSDYTKVMEIFLGNPTNKEFAPFPGTNGNTFTATIDYDPATIGGAFVDDGFGEFDEDINPEIRNRSINGRFFSFEVRFYDTINSVWLGSDQYDIKDVYNDYEVLSNKTINSFGGNWTLISGTLNRDPSFGETINFLCTPS
jgi:uncharacterized lipoprotein YehR (DUF1307 family)